MGFLDNKIFKEDIKRGKLNLITDVPGVRVGHKTINKGDARTGVTAIIPHGGNLFKDKVMAACSVINGFGKSVGLVQIDELGTIETPILMTNTFSVGTASTALIKYMLEDNDDIGRTTGTINPIVTECNDGILNDIRGFHVTEEDVLMAINCADTFFAEGAVGSGTGMTCMGLKGGIGSASRIVTIDEKEFVVGAIVMSNFGTSGDLLINGKEVGKEIEAERKSLGHEIVHKTDKGSIIIVIATDIPLNERQLKRLSKRATIGLARTGSHLGNGSGDICISFTTANRLPHYSDSDIIPTNMFYDENIDKVTRAGIEAVEESIISSLYHSETTIGYSDKIYYSLKEFIK
ncbi:MAG: P1 family peptidase [Anaerovoracaceae bacterium]